MNKDKPRPTLEARAQAWIEQGQALWKRMKRRRKEDARREREERLEKAARRCRVEAHRLQRKSDGWKKRRRKLAEASRRRNRPHTEAPRH